MTKEQVLKGYLMNSPKVIAEMLYDTITKYENKIKDLNTIIDNLKLENENLKK